MLGDLRRRDTFAADPQGQAPATVEEILRMSSPGRPGLLRDAHEDVEVGGVAIARGEAVLISTGAANRVTGGLDRSRSCGEVSAR